VLTLDVPALGKRERDVRNPFTLSEHLSLKNLLPAGCQELPKNVASFASLFDATLTWKDIEWLARLTKLPVLVKGILRADAALRASQTALARESTGREWSFPFEATSRWFEGVQINSTVTQAKRTQMPSNPTPVSSVVHVSPADTGSARVSVPVVTISPAASDGLI
jgi:hypothetical protein